MQTASEDDDVYHFIAYTPHEGKVYEIDGLTSGPVAIGALPACAGETLLTGFRFQSTNLLDLQDQFQKVSAGPL
jgi:hypothetical protein